MRKYNFLVQEKSSSSKLVKDGQSSVHTSVCKDGRLSVLVTTYNIGHLKPLLFIFLLFPLFVHAQYTPKYEYAKKTRDTVLMNTDHFYFGGEMGFGFNIGPTATILAGNGMETNVAPFEMYDFSSTTPTKFFAGYAWKSHHFEGSLGMVRERINLSIMDSLGGRAIDFNRSKTYVTFTARYFYRFPIKIPRMKMMMGAELGVGYNPNFLQSQSHYTVNDTSYYMSTSSIQNHRFQLMLGISGRMDIKIFKNVTIVLISTIIGSPMRGSEYAINYLTPGASNQTAQVYGSILNINLNAGLKFDFFTHKKKKATYDRLGIEDPYRDK